MKTKKNSSLMYGLASILVLLTAASFAACSDNETTTPKETDERSAETGTSTETEAVTEDPRLAIPDNLPEANFGGYEFVMEMPIYDKETGDTLNDTIYRVQTLVEERYNITFKETGWSGLGYEEMMKNFINMVQAGDDDVDVGKFHSTGCCPTLVSSHAILDWNDIPHIDLTQPWWNNDVTIATKLAGKQYFIAGWFQMSDPFGMFYNKVLAEQYDLPDIYQTVISGKWTLDKLLEISEKVSRDLNGDGTWMATDDQYGVMYDNNASLEGFMYGAGIKSVLIDDDGKPQPNINTDRFQTMYEKVSRLTYEDNRCLFGDYTKIDNEGIPAFMEGRVLLWAGTLLYTRLCLRDCTFEYSVIPYPKLDEEQEGYYSYTDAWNGVLCVPTTAEEPERTGIITEAYAAEMWKRAVPVFYNQVLGEKYAQNPESVKMLDLCIKGTMYDFGYMYDNGMGIGWALPNMILGKKPSAEGYWASKEMMATRWFNRLFEYAAETE